MIFENKVDINFRLRIIEICRDLGIEIDWLMACIAFETGETFSPSVRNGAGSGAVGLIQFMPRTAQDLGTTTDELAAMSARKQLDYVERYFLRWKNKLHSLEDVYMAILWPRAVGKPMDYVLFDESNKASRAYFQNRGLDVNKDGKITKAEAAAKVRAKLEKGKRNGGK